MNDKKINKILTLLLKTGQMLLESGAETYRAEETVVYLFNSITFGEIDVFAIPTAINIDIVINDIHYSGIKSVRRRDINLEVIEKINTFSRYAVKNGIDVDTAFEALALIENEKKGKTLFMIFSFGMAAGFFSLMLGGGFVEFVIAFLSCMLVQFMGKITKISERVIFFHAVIGGALPAILAKVFFNIFHFGDVNIIVIASMLPLFPGISTVNAIRDAVWGDLVSGISRLLYAAITAVALALGAAAIFAVM